MSAGLKLAEWNGLDAAAQATLLMRPAVRDRAEIRQQAADLIARVRTGGDAALIEITRELDGVELDSLRVGDAEIANAEELIAPGVARALELAIDHVGQFHGAQQNTDLRIETAPGIVCERITRPVQSVGLYVPAGSAPLPSTAIMLAVPAALAGCPRRILCTPPREDGLADPSVVFAARACGIQNIFKLGGAQAIAAMAYGTASVPKVDKIYGPGNAWVTAAKQAVSRDPAGAAQDMPAGPSEIMVIADHSANPDFVAMDLLSQAEHGPDSQVVLVCTDKSIAARVNESIGKALSSLSRQDIIRASLGNGSSILAADLDQAIAIANSYAPEHLVLQCRNPRSWLEKIHCAGSVFLGPWTPEALGDYCSGTNHVLPTYGYARTCSGLSVADFQVRITVQEASRQGLQALAPVIETLAGLEGLDAHAQAARVRVNSKGNAAPDD